YIRKNDPSNGLFTEIIARWDAGSGTAVQLSDPASNTGGSETPNGINASGTVFGVVNLTGMVFPAGGGSATLVGPQGEHPLPSAINDQGTIVGSRAGSGIRWNPGQTQGTFIGGSNVKGINNSGMIIGSGSNGTPALRWSPGATAPETLGKLSPTDFSAPSDLN